MKGPQTRLQLRQFRNIANALRFESRGDERAHGRKELRIGLRRHRPGLSLCAEAVAAGQKIAPKIRHSERNTVPIEISRVDGGR